jgi:hypothetical protein
MNMDSGSDGIRCATCGKGQWGSNACLFQNRCNGFGGPSWQAPRQHEDQSSHGVGRWQLEWEKELKMAREKEAKQQSEEAARQAKIQEWEHNYRASLTFMCSKCGKQPQDSRRLCFQDGGCMDIIVSKKQKDKEAFVATLK